MALLLPVVVGHQGGWLGICPLDILKHPSITGDDDYVDDFVTKLLVFCPNGTENNREKFSGSSISGERSWVWDIPPWCCM